MTDLTDDRPVSRDDYETALYVLETLRDHDETHESAGGILNDAHYTLQMEAELHDIIRPAPTDPVVETVLSVREMVRATNAAGPFEAGYDITTAHWLDDGVKLGWEDPDQFQRGANR